MNTNKIKTLGLLCSAMLIGACSDSSNDNDNAGSDAVETLSFMVEVTNISANQPFSPLALVAHGEEYTPWSLGETASEGLELLAESGDLADFLDEAEAMGVAATAAGSGILMPGHAASLIFETPEHALELSLATMLVNTNDAFVGLNGYSLAGLALNQSSQVNLAVYDAGTEFNSELSGSIPGPADGGEGYNAQRDDVDYVARHPGVVADTAAHPETVLDSTHRFDQPLATLLITRLE